MRYGVAIVLSTISGMPASWAMSATAAMSSVSSLGLPTVSAYSSLVSGLMARRKFSGSLGSTRSMSRPNRGSVWTNRL